MEKKPTGMDFFRAGYGDKTIDIKDILEKEKVEEVPSKPSILNMIAEGYKKNN